MCCSVGIFFLGIEFTLRITGLQTVRPNPPKIYQTNLNPEISYELKPNLNNEKAYKAHVSTDQYGFRTHNKNLKAQNPKLTLAVLGDSITFGYGVEDDESLPAVIESLATTYRVLNAAIPGYSLSMEMAAYETKIAKLKPDALMLVFFWNDLDGELPGKLDNIGVLRAHDWEPGQDRCMPINEGLMRFIPGKCWLDMHSALYKALKRIINLRQSKAIQQEARIPEIAEQETVQSEFLTDYVRQLGIFARSLPAKRYFVIWPDNNLHTDTKPTLTEAAKRNGFVVIDLYEVFGNHVETHAWDTVHPNAASIRKAAEHIAPFLQR